MNNETRRASRPRVHVVMCTFEPFPPHVAQQIDSILRQASVEISLSIYDDGSSATTTTYLKEIADARVSVRTMDRVGVFNNFERALHHAPRDVDMILLSDQDDVWHDTKAVRLLEALNASPGALLVHSDAHVIDSEGRLLKASMFDAERRDVRRLDVEHLILKNVVTGCTTGMRPKLLEHALPFPKQWDPVPFHHDLWLAICAAAVGQVVTVEEPLMSYRQHSSNVVGLEPRRKLLTDPRRLLQDWSSRRDVAAAVSEALRAGQLPAGGPARVASHWSSRLGALYVLRRSLRWKMERDPQATFAFVLGLVGVGGLLRWLPARAAPAVATARSAVRLAGRIARDGDSRHLLAARIRQEAAKPVLDDARSPDPSWLTPMPAVPAEPNSGRVWHVLVPYIPESGVFGGVATALRVAVELSHQGERVQVLEVTKSDGLAASRLRSSVAQSLGVPQTWMAGITFASAIHRHLALTVGGQDVFVATAWWTALRAAGTLDSLGMPPRLCYLVQDYEPGFYPAGDERLLAESSYKLPCVPVVNSLPLASFLERHTDLDVSSDLVLAPQIELARLTELPRRTSSERALRVLLYGRPSIPRNLFGTAVRALATWARARDESRPLEIVSAGEHHAPVQLSRGLTIASLGQLSWDRYEAELTRSDIGLSLMLSPHPSYPPLEMAAAGLVVVTNRFAEKDLSHVAPSIVSCDPDADAIADGLAVAERQLGLKSDRTVGLELLGRSISDVTRSLRTRWSEPVEPGTN